MSPKTSTAEAGASGNRQLSVTVEPENANNKEVTFNVDDATELTVSNKGKIEWTENTPPGQYKTTITTVDGGFTAEHTLTLEEPEPEGFIIPRLIEVLEGGKEQLTSRETVRSWASGNELVASVNNNGEVVGIKEGICEIRATAASGKEDSITIVVLENEKSELDTENRVGPTSIKIIPEEHTFVELGLARTMKLEIEPLNALTDVEWISSDENIVRHRPDLGPNFISSWNTVGTATITVRSTVNGVEGTATIHAQNG